MHACTNSTITSLAVKHIGKYAVAVDVHDPLDPVFDIVMTKLKTLYESDTDACRIIHDHLISMSGVFFFDTASEQATFFNVFNADPVYSSSIYACTYSPTGECLDENT